MIEFSERDTKLILQALHLLAENNQQNTEACIDLNRIINRIEKNNIDRHIRNTWRAMLDRCRNKNNPFYSIYGGKGISVCEEWHHLKNFKEWCLNNDYKIGLTIDRINGEKNYSPDNCRLATQKEQQRNRSNNRKIVDPFDGEILCMSEIADKYNINLSCLSNRLNKQKMNIKEALEKPIRKVSLIVDNDNNKITICDKLIMWHDNELAIGEEYTMKRMAEELKVNIRSLSAAITSTHNKVVAELIKPEFQYKKYKEGNLYIKKNNWRESRNDNG